MFHNKDDLHDRPSTLRTHINHALNDGATSTVQIAWHIATVGQYPTCTGEIGALLAEDPQYTCDKQGHWRRRDEG